MDLLPSSEQEEIISSVRAVLTDNYTVGEPLTNELLNAASAQGWAGLALHETAGGVGYTVVEEALLFQELGHFCVPGNFLAASLGAAIAAEAGQSTILSSILEGTARVSLAQRFSPTEFAVENPLNATHAVVLHEEWIGLFEISALGENEDFSPFDTLIAISKVAAPDSAHAVAIAASPDELRLRGSLLVAAELAGMARATAEQSVAYAKDREQFGQPIGGFQAVKHRCADMATLAEAAECQVRYASLALRDRRPDAEFHVHAARVVASNAAINNAQINVQNHGGIGFTWEHTAHRYVTRVRVRAATCGTRVTELSALIAAEPAV